MKKTLAILMAVAMLGLLAVGCGGDSGNGGASDPGAGDSLFVGCLAPLTGEVSAYGVTTKEGKGRGSVGWGRGKQHSYSFKSSRSGCILKYTTRRLPVSSRLAIKSFKDSVRALPMK